MSATPSNPAQNGQPNTAGYNASEGHAASLRQQATWIAQAIVGKGPVFEFGDIDTDELLAAADFIEQNDHLWHRIRKLEHDNNQAAGRIMELEAVIRGLMKVQPAERHGMVLKEYQAARDAMKSSASARTPGEPNGR